FLPRSWHREGETVTWRKHWVALIRLVGLPVVAFAVVTILVLVYIAVAEMGGQPGFWVSVFAAYVGATLLLVPWVLWHFEDWQNDFYRVTATRLIHVERLPFYLREERREAHLEQITNVRSEQSFLGRFLRYGDVIVETAAPAGTFHLRKVSQPQRVQSEIFSHIEASRQRQRERQAERQRAELLDWLSAYDEMRRSGTPSDEGSKESD
ncbi:MAG: PH domain-containing protein, partial [Anaerolineae bacterium]